MADIKNKNELKRRIELFMDELDYSINKDYCMETMRMMREFIGHASHRLDCTNSKIKSSMAKLREYQKLEEQGLLLRLPCGYNETLYWIVDGKIREVWFKGIRCDKGYKPQIIARYMVGLSAKEEPITKLDNIGKTVFLTREEAEQALKHTENAR